MANMGWREKTPDLPRHTNFWGGGSQLFEWDAGETGVNDFMGARQPNWGHGLTFGPCHGYFKIIGAGVGDTLFISHDDTAIYSDYQPTGGPTHIIINGFDYDIDWKKDTFWAVAGYPFPSSLATSTDTFTYYFGRWGHPVSDTVRWYVTKGGPLNHWCILHTPYYFRHGDSMYFTRNYQPAAVILSAHVDSLGDTSQMTYHCHWIDSLNNPTNKGILYMDDSLLSGDAKSNTERYTFILPDAYAGWGDGFGYRVPPYQVNGETSNTDTAALDTIPYRYHTFTMEWLPHEVRFLYDSVVVYRFPDRMIPPGDPYYDWVERFGRSPVNILPGEFDGDDELNSLDSHGNPTQSAQITQNFFLAHLGNASMGFWNGAAHHLLDYVKVWDVPRDVIIPGFPK